MGESESGDTLEFGEVVWTYETDLRVQVLEATTDGVLVGGTHWINLVYEAEVFALDHEGVREWTGMWDPEQPIPELLGALASDAEGVWVGFASGVLDECSGCPHSGLARLNPTGAELWRLELGDVLYPWQIRTIGVDAVIVSAGSGMPGAQVPGAEVHRVGPDGTLIWERVFDAEPESIYSTGIELFEGALWVVGKAQDPEVPWMARLDPDTGTLLEIVDTSLLSGPLNSPAVLPTGLAVVGTEHLWVLDGSAEPIWTRELSDAYWIWCLFDARSDGLSAVACKTTIDLLDPQGQSLATLEGPPLLWTLALGEQLFLADDPLDADDPTLILAVQLQ
jgi:outer membrane protein assembly factor BamB